MILNTFQLLIFSPLMILGAFWNEWSVEYSKNPCAVKGSTVVMNGTYTHPTYVRVNKRFWVKGPVKDEEPTDLRNEPGYSGRVKYSGDKQNHFSLRLSDVNKSDEHEYSIRVKGDKNYLYHPGIILNVTELRVEAPETVVEGNVTVLVCNTTCSPSDTPKFIWYKDDNKIIGKNISGNTLILKPTKADDAGGYSCAVRGYEDLRSPARSLSVKYRPRNISVSISPSGEIVEGILVTLTCSADANPPVKTCEWFKWKTTIKKEMTHTISEISSEDSGEYKCKCSNEVGCQYSGGVTLNVLYPPKNVSVSISPSGELVEGSSVTLTCSADANPPVENYTWFKGTKYVGNGKTYTISKISFEDSGDYKCKCINKVGPQYSINVTLPVTEMQNKSQTVVIAVIILCLAGLVLIIIIALLRKKKMFCWSEERPVSSENNAGQSAASDDVQYASIPHPRRAEGSAQNATDQGLYANVQRKRGHQEEEELQYATVNFSSSNRSEPATATDNSVIYSSVTAGTPNPSTS